MQPDGDKLQKQMLTVSDQALVEECRRIVQSANDQATFNSSLQHVSAAQSATALPSTEKPVVKEAAVDSSTHLTTGLPSPRQSQSDQSIGHSADACG